MLSIIISSYKQDYFEQLENNIKSSIGDGFLYEIIKIENHSKYSLTQAYNIGGKKAKYDNLLFIHEDIIFETKNWGNILVKLLSVKDCGVIGVAGGSYYAYVPGSWWNKGYNFLHLKQVDPTSTTFNNKANFKKDNEEAIALDGVFMACKKNVFDEIGFDERIDNYHGYDLIFSLQVSKKYQNYVTSEILIHHFSAGNLDRKWLENIIKVREIVGFNPAQKIDKKLEVNNFYKLINQLKLFNYSRAEAFKIIYPYLSVRLLGLSNVIKILNRLKYL
ncbi:glycosyltransferase [Soonwooa sp.]|uniref:glycosyltransferase n=1 Tax=Soonwooa sp. TaxID=1938592 RepID=UPI00262496B3|nr:glycosyltransferase [Soonwooa sp.]